VCCYIVEQQEQKPGERSTRSGCRGASPIQKDRSFNRLERSPVHPGGGEEEHRRRRKLWSRKERGE